MADRLKAEARGYGGGVFERKPGLVHRMPTPTRLALEMALHEEQEMRALAGELIELELQWRQAEEIAGIADDMFVPQETRDFIARHRAGAEAAGATIDGREEEG